MFMRSLPSVARAIRYLSVPAFAAAPLSSATATAANTCSSAVSRVAPAVLAKPSSLSALFTSGLRRLSTSATGTAAVEKALSTPYPFPLQLLHWGMGIGILTCIATVKLCQWTDDKKKKGEYMHIHKSTAVLVLAMLPFRLMYLFADKTPKMPGNPLITAAGRVSHFALYGLMIIMPISGVAMGYFGGKGIPFFNWHIDGAGEGSTKPDVAKKAYNLHKKMGVALEYIVPIHVGGALFHVVLGQNVFKRMGLGLLSSFGIVQAPSTTTDELANE